MKKFLYFILILLVLVLPVILPVVANAQGSMGNGQTNSGTIDTPPGVGPGLKSPLAGGVDNINSFLLIVIEKIIFPIGSIIIVIMIIYTGFLFVIARGNPSKIEDARRMLLYVVIGAAILLGAGAIALVIKNTICEIASIPGCPGVR